MESQICFIGVQEMYMGWDHKKDHIPNANHMVLPLLKFLSEKHCKIHLEMELCKTNVGFDLLTQHS